MTVLLAYNDTPQGNAALDVAVGEARRRSTTLTILCLTASAPGASWASDPSATAQLGSVADVVAEATRAVEQVPADLGAPALLYRDGSVVPAEAILDAAERTTAELVVLGARKRPDVGMFLLGTTTQRVLLDSPAPVLVVKASDEPAA